MKYALLFASLSAIGVALAGLLIVWKSTYEGPPVAERSVESHLATTTLVTASTTPVFTSTPASTTPIKAQPVVKPPPVATTSAPVASTSASKLDYRFGFSLATTQLSLSDDELAAELDDLASMKVGWIRMDFDWSVIQPRSASEFRWSDYDRVVAAARARGIDVLGIIDFTPRWARADDCAYFKCPPKDNAAFAAFAAAVAKRYAPLGLHHWEIWNEPNMSGTWYPKADARAYVALLRETYPALKAADPLAVVITGGLGPIENENGNISALPFLQAIYAEGGKPYFDAVAFHPYSFPVPPSAKRTWSAWSQMSETKVSFRSVMVGAGDASKKIWITEYGAPTGGPGPVAGVDDYNFVFGSPHVTEALQALMVREAAERVKTYDWAGPLFIYSYKDIGTSSNTMENFFGLIRYDGTRKPAYQAYRDAISHE